ncbi:MAG TPA: ParB/RepB/Spo0J family partition protein [Anaerolineae bacterium]|nr:ParB/RepB/Spo0J family partition protein [Anaerolineae bacterium]
MHNKKIGLGRGLGALLPGSDLPSNSGLAEVPVRAIQPNPHQPRGFFDEQALHELADSIREHGLIQPLIVVRSGEDHYTLIAGERRWRAAQIAGLDTVPVVVKDAAPQQMLEMALVENIQRADLNPLEEALAYKQLAEEFGLTQEQIAQRVGKSRVAVANILRLLKLPEPIKARLADGLITEGHARALLAVTDQAAQQHLLSQIVKNNLSVRQTEELVRRRLDEQQPTTRKAAAGHRISADSRALEDRMRRVLGTKVSLFRSKKGGTLVIHFYSEEELDSIYRRIVKSD